MRVTENQGRDNASVIGRLLPLTQGKGQKMDVDGQGRHFAYLNPAQVLEQNFGARDTKTIGGRGTGKTTSHALHIMRCVQGIPRGTGGFLGCSYAQLVTKTWPNVLKSLEQMGWKEGVHFFRGQAPAKLKWPTPLTKPRSWENVTHFYTGFAYHSISMEMTAPGNSYNFCTVDGDEVRFMKWSKVQESILPALRGELVSKASGLKGLGGYDSFRDTPAYGVGWDPKLNPYYLSQYWTSDAALTVKQAEWEKEEDKQTTEINDAICDMLAEVDLMPELAQLDGFQRRLHELRCQSSVMFRFSSLMNAEILGLDYIRRMKRDLPPLVFAIQVMGQRKGLARDGYYCNFDTDVHGYTCNDAQVSDLIHNKYTARFNRMAMDSSKTLREVEYEAVDLKLTGNINDCSLDIDIDPDEPLRLSFDFNANINCLVVGQARMFDGQDSLVVLKSMFTQNERKLRELCRDFSVYYRPQRMYNPDVIVYLDSTARQGAAYALEESDSTRYENVVIEELTRAGWNVIPVHMGRPMRHDQKYQFINDVLSFQQKPALKINVQPNRNEHLIVAMENCQVRTVGNLIKKDKSGEKLQAKSEDAAGAVDPRNRSDITDALDTLLIGTRFYGTGSVARGLQGVLVSAPIIL